MQTDTSSGDTDGGSSAITVTEFESDETAAGVLDDNTLAPDQDEDIHPFEEDFEESAPYMEDDPTDSDVEF
ncbi:hypothetical protein [Salinibaculum rarum]|uniref:hypothetical protein n=1 Tax=Salinibaculum rarum TaxID=3058903 RepID=UPI00265D7A44|nr:hypothetical protein [Salinibaculum sp. KK48]